MELVTRAANYARNAHKGQLRDDGEEYIVHPQQVASIIARATDDKEMIAAAYLHDTIEDTETTEEDLRALFGDRITDLVMELTHETTEWGEHYFPRLKTVDGAMLKFADRLSNLSSMSGAWDEKRQAAYLRKSTFWETEPPVRGHK